MTKLFNYDENGQSQLVAENVSPVRYCNDGYYHLCDECNAQYYVNDDDTLLLDKNGKAVWQVEDIGEEEHIYEVKSSV